MEMGVGIHGEPGRKRVKLAAADAIADQMVGSSRKSLTVSGSFGGYNSSPLQFFEASFPRRNSTLRRFKPSAPRGPMPVISRIPGCDGAAEWARRKVAALHEALEDEESRDEAVELIRGLIEAVVLTPIDSHLRVEVRGELAAILALGDGRRNPGTTDQDSVEQIKMVAGARNHREFPICVVV
jgi:hypothetical protein